MPNSLGIPLFTVGLHLLQWQGMALHSSAAANSAAETPIPGFLSLLRMGQPESQVRQPTWETYSLHTPGQLRVRGDTPVYTPDTKLGGGGSSEGAVGSEGAPGSAGNASQNNASHEQAESQEQANEKGRRSKEDVQKRNKEVRLYHSLLLLITDWSLLLFFLIFCAGECTRFRTDRECGVQYRQSIWHVGLGWDARS